MMPSQPVGLYDVSSISGTHGLRCSCTYVPSSRQFALALYRSVTQIRMQCAFSTAAAIASNVDPDIISVSTQMRKLRSRMLAATRSTVAWTSH